MDLIRPLTEFDAENPQPGFYNLPEEVYRPAPGTNWSNLKRMAKTARSYKWFLDHPDADTDTPDKLIGRLFHTLALEPGEAPNRFATTPETYEAPGPKKGDPPVEKPWNMNAKACRFWVADQIKKGLTRITQAQLDHATAMAVAIRAIPPARELLDDADGLEVSIFWHDPQTGTLCKGKLDIIKDGLIADFKKVSAKGGGRAAPGEWEAFSSHVWAWGLYGQAAFYRDGTNAVLHDAGYAVPKDAYFRFLVVEDKEPYDVASYTISDHPEDRSRQWLMKGRETYHGLLQQVAFCRERDCWPSYNPGPDGVTEDMELIPPGFMDTRLTVSTI